MRGQARPLTIAIRYTGEKLEYQDKVKINKLPTGVPALTRLWRRSPGIFIQHHRGAPEAEDDAGTSVCVCQCYPERPALYFTVLGESAIKMLRYSSSTHSSIPHAAGSIRFINLSQVVLEKDLGAVLLQITKEVEKSNRPSWLWTPSGP